MIPIAKPHIGEDEKNAVMKVLESGVIAEGTKVLEFEKAFARSAGAKYSIAVNSGTAALHVAMLAHGIGGGDEVITSPFTFIATANSVLFTGAKPVFADIEEDTFNIDPDKILEKITPGTKAVLPVHLFGHPANMKAISEIAEDHNLIIIEDACQAHAAKFNGSCVGTFGTGAFSFYPTKNMTTGEGGMITTDDPQIYEHAKLLKSHGSKQRYLHEILGYNFRMTDIAAAIGIEQLKKLGMFTNARQENAAYLNSGLKDISGIVIPCIRQDCEHVFHQYTIRVTEDCKVDRDALIKVLNENSIGTGIYYPLPVHKQPLYRELGYTDSLPVAEKMSREVVSLPVHPSVTETDLDFIIKTIRGICE
ncbi:MAG: DegT/DnrJ/EryC1/StrS family aminotransferase [Candidatus Methanoperedens sp.]|nr:DegT/DnrJ/EryC1/StrS family aminotransferase [Candidatus Methanoperedens sp.]